MSNKRNAQTLHTIGLGGAGISICVDIANRVKDLDDGFSDFTTRLVDTTTRTIQGFPDYIDNFKHLTSNRAGGSLDGSAGERKDKEVIKDIVVGMKEYLDISNLPNEKSDYYILVSGSGGSGGTMLTVLSQLMLDRGYDVIVVIAGDSSNLLNLTNTINVLNGLQNTALKTKTALSVIYYNNSVEGQTTLSTELMVNDKVYKMSLIISAFISGNMVGIDNQDMMNFFKPSNYKTFDVKPGIYSLGITSRELNDKDTLLARTIVNSASEEYKINIDLLHNKVGIIPDRIKDNFDKYPLFLIFRKNVLNEEVKSLKVDLEKIEHLSVCSYDGFESLEDSEEDDEFGLSV